MSEIFPVNSRVAAYFRDSGGNQQGLSIDQQKAKVGEWVKANGLILTRTFADVARSGTTTVGRDSFLEMMAYFDGTVQESGLVLWEYSRLARDYDDFQFYIADLRRKGYTVHAISDSIPPGLDGRLLESITAWKNAKYSIDLGRNVQRGQRYNLNIHHGWRWPVPPGYKLEEVNIGDYRNGDTRIIHRLIPDPVTAPLVKRAFEMRLGGSTMREIHEAFHFVSTIEGYMRMLKNPLYMGVFDHQGVHIDDYCEPLVDQDTFNRVQALIASRASRKGVEHPRVIRSRFFLSGLLFCGKCNGGMYGKAESTYHSMYHYNYYKCYGNAKLNTGCTQLRVRKEWIEDRVLEIVRDVILNPDVLHDIYEETQAQASRRDDGRKAEIASIKEQMRNNDAQLKRILAAIKEVGHSRVMLVELNLLEGEQATLQVKLEEAQKAIVPLAVPDFDEMISLTNQALEGATDQQKAIVVRGFVRRIVLERKWKRQITGRLEYSVGDSLPYFIDI